MSDKITCPSWCARQETDCDHWSDPGGAEWPAVRATAYPDHEADLVAHPVWGEIDGLEPSVALWVTGEGGDNTIDMTPEEAIALAAYLLQAAAAVRAG